MFDKSYKSIGGILMKNDSWKILLVSFYNDEAYGLRLLHSALTEKEFDTKMLFIKLSSQKKEIHKEKLISSYSSEFNVITEKEEEILVRFLTEYKPKLIGFSLVSPHFELYKKIYHKIKNIGDFKILLGGWQVSLNPEQCIEYADILCLGEGEEILPELVQSLSNNISLCNISNIWYKEGDKIIKNSVKPLVKNIDKFPYPIINNAQSFVLEDNQLVQNEPYMQNSRYGVMTTRGCPFACTYCSNSFMAEKIYSKEWSKTRYRSLENVMDELNYVKEKLPNIKKINFYDEVFLPEKHLGFEFFKRYVKEISLPFYCMFYPGTCNDELAKQLKDSMLAGVWLGIQSGSYRIRKDIYKRNYTNEQLFKQIDIFHRNQIDVRYDIIMNNPFESFNETLETIDLLLALPEPFSVNLFSLKFFPNTEITKMALENGIITYDEVNDQLKDYQSNYLIARTNNNDDNNFLNHIAMAISILATRGSVQKEKKKIRELIHDYSKVKSITKAYNYFDSIIDTTT